MCDAGDKLTYFIDIGQGVLDITRDVTQVRVHPSIRRLRMRHSAVASS